MRRIEIILGDITKLQVDAIVNAANTSLLGGGGVDGAIHRAAGPDLLAECRLLNGCPAGKAKITKGYNLPAKHVIHTVGPVWGGGGRGESGLLSSCYFESLKIAAENNIRTIAFPNISTGVYSFPKEQAAAIAMKSVLDFLNNQSTRIEKIIFCCFDRENFDIYNRIKEESVDFIKVRTPEDISLVAGLAEEIWNEHYVPIIGKSQVDYMVGKFQSAQAIDAQISRDGFIYYLIYQNFLPVGYIGIKKNNEELFLSKFYILSNNRGSGLGRKAYDFIVFCAKELNTTTISLTVNKENSNTIKVYEKLGFLNAGPVVADIGNGYIMDDFLMKYDLDKKS